MSIFKTKKPWYTEGLSFECQKCGDCCRGPGGYVWLSEEEARRIAEVLQLDFNKFAQTMLRQTMSGIALVDGPNGDCPLLAEDGCRVYEDRPRQCRTWPWWREVVANPERWEREKTRCPGIGQGKLHSRVYIEAESAKEF